MSNELAKTASQQTALEVIPPSNEMASIKEVGKWLCQMFKLENDAMGCMVALACRVKRQDPFQFFRENHIMFNRVYPRAENVLAKFKAKPGNSWKWIKDGDDGKEARALVTTPDESREVSFTIEMAIKRGLAKKNSKYETEPGEMLRARCITKGVKMMDPSVDVGDETDFAEVAPPSASLQLDKPAPVVKEVLNVTTGQTHEAIQRPAIIEAEVTEQPAPVSTRVAAEMQARADSPLPADIQPIETKPPQPFNPPAELKEASLPAEQTALFKATTNQHGTTTIAPASDLPQGLDPWLVAFAEKAPANATPFFRAKNWISDKQTWLDLKPAQIAMLKTKPAMFERQLANFQPAAK